MANYLDDFTQAEFDRQLSIALYELSHNAVRDEVSKAYLLGGQSGAGKTRLHKICTAKMGGNAIVINGDEYRKSHPHFYDIQAAYGMDAPAHTARWSGAMTEALIDALSSTGYNLVIEGTLRTSKVPLKTAELLRSRGYGVSLAVMAVKPELSLISCQIRYEMMRIAGTTPRATDPNHHAGIVRDIVDNLAALEESGAFEAVELYDRAGRRLFPRDDSDSASEVLRNVLYGPWTEEERLHQSRLEAELESLRKMRQSSDG